MLKTDPTLNSEQIGALIDYAGDAMVAIDNEPRILLFNRAAEALFGFSSEEAVGTSAGLLFSPETHARIQEAFEKPPECEVAAGDHQLRLQCRSRSGDELAVDASLTTVSIEGREIALLILRNARRPKKSVPESAKEPQEPELSAAEQLWELTRLPTQIAHDFNNLFAVIMGSLELLEDHVEPDSQATVLLDRAIRGTELAIKLTQRLMAIARHQDFRPAAVDLAKLLQGIELRIAPLLGETIDMQIDVAEDLRPCRTDPVQLAAAVMHMALNASEAMPDGGRLTVEAGNDTANSAVVLSIRDEGLGMAPEVAARAADLGFTSKTDNGRRGIGLSYVSALAQRSGGELEIASTPGKGTTVSLRLPWQEDAASATPVASKRPQERKLVLVVEDDVNVRDYAINALRDLGYATLAVGTAREALDMLEKIADIDLLFSDILLPGGMSGVELVEKAQARWPHLRVLLTSGYAKDVLSKQKHLRKDVAIIEKPYLMIELAMMLADVFEKRQE